MRSPRVEFYPFFSMFINALRIKKKTKEILYIPSNGTITTTIFTTLNLIFKEEYFRIYFSHIGHTQNIIKLYLDSIIILEYLHVNIKVESVLLIGL